MPWVNDGQFKFHENANDSGLSLEAVPDIQNTPEDREKARKTILSRAESPADAVDLLAMLGLLKDNEAALWAYEKEEC